MALESVVKGVAKRPPRIVVYGPPKIGKSTLGSESESPIFLPTEEGIDNLPVDRFPVVRSWEELLGRVKEVAEGKHEFKTLVLDTMNGATELAAQAVCTTKFGGDWGPKGFASFGQGWAATSEEMRKLVPLLDACRARGMTVLMLAHTGVQTVRNPIDGDYSKFCPDLDRRVWARFAAWADVILRADFDYVVLGGDKGGKGRVKGSNTRILKCSGSAAEDAGCRVGYELPDSMPLSWQAVAEALGKDSQTLKAVKGLWGLLSEAEQQKALGWLGVKKLEDAQTNKLRQLLNRLKEREKEVAVA